MVSLEAIFDFIDRRSITRRLMTLGTFAMVLKVIFWSMHYAETSARPGSDVGLILAAITAPLSALMGYMFAQYVAGAALGGGEGRDAVQTLRTPSQTLAPQVIVNNQQAPPPS